jgi:hypothetical protein
MVVDSRRGMYPFFKIQVSQGPPELPAFVWKNIVQSEFTAADRSPPTAAEKTLRLQPLFACS